MTSSSSERTWIHHALFGRHSPWRFATLVLLAAVSSATALAAPAVFHRTVPIKGVNIFYREAGPADAPVILLLHGFPTSSHQFRGLIPQLAVRYRVIAPDYPGFGQSDAPPIDAFTYTFENLTDIVEAFTAALRLDRFSLFVHDYGAPVGFRLAVRHPDRVEAIITQNGNAYEEGLTPFWNFLRNEYWKQPTPEHREHLKESFTFESMHAITVAGARDPARLSPDFWTVSHAGVTRPGNAEIQLALFLDYRTNPPLYPRWQQYLREKQPPTLIVWGKNDAIFGPEGAIAFLRDVRHAELHLLDTGHFALEEDGELIGEIMLRFLDRTVGSTH